MLESRVNDAFWKLDVLTSRVNELECQVAERTNYADFVLMKDEFYYTKANIDMLLDMVGKLQEELDRLKEIRSEELEKLL